MTPGAVGSDALGLNETYELGFESHTKRGCNPPFSSLGRYITAALPSCEKFLLLVFTNAATEVTNPRIGLKCQKEK
jgi:hypothetical protein